MSTLIETLASIKNENNRFIERLDLIKGYNEAEIKEIEQRYNLSIHGQFKELLMTMGKCSGGLLFGDDIFMYSSFRTPSSQYFGTIAQNNWQTSWDLLELVKEKQWDFVEKQLFHFSDENDHCIHYLLFTRNQDDIIYEYNECFDETQGEKAEFKVFGTLFDYLKFYRKFVVSYIYGNEKPDLFEQLTTGRLL